jgi:hypothetical protein
MQDAKHNWPAPIAEWYSLDYYRRPLATRRWKSPWNWAFFGLSLAGLVALYAAQREASFQAAPVSSVHSMFADKCSACHDGSWQPLARLATLSDAHHSVSDAACQACHKASAHVTSGLAEPACASCHQEHRPGHSLTDLADTSCTQCHGDLTARSSSTGFHATIAQFAEGNSGHPEFELLRAGDAAVSANHRTHEVGVLVSSDAETRWLDRGGLKFNHQHHLDPAKILDPSTRKSVTLTCADCHTPEADGAYMKPIVYERHCARCHPLKLGTLGEFPHASVEQVRGVLRERLAKRRELSAAKSSKRELPLLPAPAHLTADQEQELERMMLALDRAVFAPEAKGMCRHCHHVEQRDGNWHVSFVNPNVSQTAGGATMMVPDRWLQHGEFHHGKHRAIACGECHTAATSDSTADILLPSITECRKCHGPDAAIATTRVRDNCTLCHTYHKEGNAHPGLSLQRIFVGNLDSNANPSSQ